MYLCFHSRCFDSCSLHQFVWLKTRSTITTRARSRRCPRWSTSGCARACTSDASAPARTPTTAVTSCSRRLWTTRLTNTSWATAGRSRSRSPAHTSVCGISGAASRWARSWTAFPRSTPARNTTMTCSSSASASTASAPRRSTPCQKPSWCAAIATGNMSRRRSRWASSRRRVRASRRNRMAPSSSSSRTRRFSRKPSSATSTSSAGCAITATSTRG